MESRTWHEREAWDPLLRLFHWALALAVGVAWWTHGGDLRLHLLAGAAIGGLLLFRVWWGFAGGRHARFADFRPTPASLARHVRCLMRRRPVQARGHTPLGSLMIFALLGLLGWMWASGMALAGLELGIGPLAAWRAGFGTETWLLTWHERVADVLPVLVGVHLAGVLTESALARENLVRAMITGRKRMMRKGGKG